MSDKPIIRHCKNCEYSCEWILIDSCCITCKVKYKSIYHQRLVALFCKYFKKVKETHK